MLRLIRLILCLFVVSLTSLSIMAGDFVVVLDPGHGGHDYGAIGAKAREKDINLGVALKLGALLKKEKGVKVVYTRDGDYFKTLQQRADIANKAHGDLFISIHTNSLDKKARNRKTISGASTYTLGLHKSAENLAVAKRENAVMMLEDDFSTTYCGFDPNSTESYIIFELSQNNHLDQSIDFAGKLQSEMKSTAGRVDRGVRQAGFWVLAKTSMPAIPLSSVTSLRRADRKSLPRRFTTPSRAIRPPTTIARALSLSPMSMSTMSSSRSMMTPIRKSARR